MCKNIHLCTSMYVYTPACVHLCIYTSVNESMYVQMCVHFVCICKFMPERRDTCDSYSMSRSACPLVMAAGVEQHLQKGDLITGKC